MNRYVKAQITIRRGKKHIHPPTVPGHQWKPDGLTGWMLFTRVPSISKNGKRSSRAKYLGYYSQKVLRKAYG